MKINFSKFKKEVYTDYLDKYLEYSAWIWLFGIGCPLVLLWLIPVYGVLPIILLGRTIWGIPKLFQK